MTPRESLTTLITYIHSRGWSEATGGNYSCLLSSDPLRVLMTPSGVDKGSVKPEDLLEIDGAGQIAGDGKPSAETLLHFPIYRQYGAGVVLHTHSVANTILSLSPDDYLEISGLEMLKALSGVTTHEHVERIPILDNSQDMPALAVELSRVAFNHPNAHAVLLRGHGMYTWGASFAEAKRHLEALEFLFEIVRQA